MLKRISRKRWLRERYYRDNRCDYCNIRTYLADGPLQATVDHQVPQSVRRWNHHTNYALACFDCNQKKAAMSCATFMALRDSDGSGEADETRSGSAVGDSAGPKDIAQTPEVSHD